MFREGFQLRDMYSLLLQVFFALVNWDALVL